MRKASEETSTPDHNKRRIIMIQSDTSKILADKPTLEKRQQPFIENLKQNADTNNPIEEGLQQPPKLHTPTTEPTKIENANPPNEIVPFHFDMIYASLFQLKQQIFTLTNRLESIQKRLDRGENRQESQHQGGHKKKRRRAQEIIKNYLCSYPSCKKAYGSEMSLNLHMKIKHQAKIEIPQIQQSEQDSNEHQGSSRNPPSPVEEL